MNALAQWKVVLTVIAIFGAGVVSGGFLMSRAVKDAVYRAEQPHQLSISTMDRLQGDLRLKREQADKVGAIVRQLDTELNNLRALKLRETDGIFSRAKDRIDPILAPDQRPRLHEILEEQRRRYEAMPHVSASPD